MQKADTYFKIVSLLLQYPDASYIRTLPKLAAAADRLAAGPERAGIEAFLADLASHDAIQLQERYTAAFDLNPATTLNVTYHKWGDGEKRAAALIRLQSSYLERGYERVTGELPDYLPLILEFLAAVPEAQQSETIRQCLEGLEPMLERLKQIAPPYVELLKPLAEGFRKRTEDRRTYASQ